MRVTVQEFNRACDTVIAFTDHHEQLTGKELRRACDSVIAFTEQNEQLTHFEHRLIFSVVRSLANSFAASSKPRDPIADIPLID